MQPFSELTGKMARCDPSDLRPRLGFAWGHVTVDKVILFLDIYTVDIRILTSSMLVGSWKTLIIPPDIHSAGRTLE
jgi:hypothetical protein